MVESKRYLIDFSTVSLRVLGAGTANTGNERDGLSHGNENEKDQRSALQFFWRKFTTGTSDMCCTLRKDLAFLLNN